MVAPTQKQPLGQLLVTRALINPDQLERALLEQKRANFQKLLGEVLVDLRLCSQEQICEALAETYHVPFVRLSPTLCDPAVMGLLHREFLEKHLVVPLFLVEGTLTLAVAEPANLFLLEEIQRLTGHSVQVVATTIADIRATIASYRSEKRMFVVETVADVAQSDPLEFLGMAALVVHSSEVDPSAMKQVRSCIVSAVRQSASEIHIEPGERDSRVRYRLHGRLHTVLTPPSATQNRMACALKRAAGLLPADSRLPQTGTIRATIDQQMIELQLSTMPGPHGEKLVLRISDSRQRFADLEKLGFAYDTLKQWRKCLESQSGLLIVTGPGGSGVTSTLYASLAELNADELNICTVEDPIAGPLPGVNQFASNAAAGFDTATALASLLRQEPDVVMLGQCADTRTAQLAVRSVLAGKRVLAAMHTPDAISVIPRLLNLGIEPYQVGASLAAVLSQRLVRKLCSACKEPYTPSRTEQRLIEKAIGHVDKCYRAKGCDQCHGIGYSGRIGVFELLVPDDAVIDRFSHSLSRAQWQETAQNTGLKSLRVDGLEKAKAGIITLDEIFRVA